ncbi:TRP-domain-containing protein [Eremomyces bilateralis CBS 781.70]|uniref:TRP-domain-containing protein n=1 Tax=Eremomyces bilateralis CBS 781.70 TaxID=1392243 RepID=A0A6G1FYH3_9PEZI|nr:TRP-domain-containing protein [Eremomyces bilateralis CBS 781.70]KAF1810824.1 TRP-domain-containing protein [Eremomyces bilateralis CBS 781.70]
MRRSLWALAALPLVARADDILRTNGYSTCFDSSDIKVEKLNIEYNRVTGTVDFDVAGTSAKEQNVTAALTVTAYGVEVYKKDFNPCEKENYVKQLCPIPSGTFTASGTQNIPSEYADQIPSIAFSIPNLDGKAKLELKTMEGGQDLACIQSTVGNGKSLDVPAVPYVAAGIAGAALLLSGASALAGGSGAGSGAPSPTFFETVGWFQSMAMNGMLSVQYPGVYRSFSKNFGFSTGLVTWDGLQSTIDNFRGRTGGNLTENSIAFLRNVTLVYPSGNMTKRAIENVFLYAREVNTEISAANTTSNGTEAEDKPIHSVEGIQAFAESLAIPKTNTFMTVLLIFACVIGAITVAILLFKVILEIWALFGTFPKKLEGFRKRYWITLSKAITSLILLLYGIWTMYCVYQFTSGDSWAAKVLAGVTLGIFTLILAFFTFRIWQVARKYKKAEGNVSGLYEDKNTWVKYNIFYENYKKGWWWMFIPLIIYMFVKGCIIAGASGNGLVQASGQLIVEALLLILLLWSRPFTLKSSNWINIIIQVVRVASVVCILIFVEELGVTQTTQTVTGVVLVVVQGVLTGALAILIAINAIVLMCKANPHRKQRKEQEKINRDFDNLTPLDPRNSLLMDPNEAKKFNGKTSYEPLPASDTFNFGPAFGHSRDASREVLLQDAASVGTGRAVSPPRDREPRLPDIEMGGYGGRSLR